MSYNEREINFMLDREDVKTIKQIVDDSVSEKLHAFEGTVRAIVEESVIEELRPLESAVRLIVREELKLELDPIKQDIGGMKQDIEKLMPLEGKVDYLNQKMEANHQEQIASLDRVERMLNNDLITVMKDAEKMGKRVSVCEMAIQKLQPV